MKSSALSKMKMKRTVSNWISGVYGYISCCRTSIVDQNSLCYCTNRHSPLIFLKASHSTPPHISLHPAFCPASYPSLNLLSIIRLLRSIFHFPLSFPGSALFLESISTWSLKSLSFFMATWEQSSKITNITY